MSNGCVDDPKGPEPEVPLTSDQIAAHQLLCELRTRIVTQSLPYQHGVEARALESLFSVFEHARTAMKENPGCAEFASLTTNTLNQHLRPVTAKWHRAMVEGRLASKDGADEFRGDLERVQGQLREFARRLQQMAYGSIVDDADTPPAISEVEIDECFGAVPLGIVPPPGLEVPLVRAIERINADEAAAIHARRGNQHLIGDAVGLALSGGGIRSATFCLGVVQVLASRGLLDDVDLLSTVSGGGYTGSFLTSTLPTGKAAELMGQPMGPDPPPIARLRANAKYLTSANLWETWSRVTATVAGMLLNWTVPLFIVISAAFLAVVVFGSSRPGPYWRYALITSSALTLVATISYGALMRVGRRASLWAGGVLAAAFGLTLSIGGLWLLHCGHTAVPTWFDKLPPVSLALAALVGAGPAIVRFVPVLQKPWARILVLKLLLLVAALIIPVLALSLLYAAWDFGLKQWDWVPLAALGPLKGSHMLVLTALVLALIAVLVVDINQTSPHRMYRDALARTFIGPRSPSLDDLDSSKAPYHLVNATVNLPSSTDARLRDRKGDFFIFSKHWCGSLTTGYYPTKQWVAGGHTPDLKTAMAISGAAASSHMGLMSMPALTALITLLNVRLGFWIKSPRSRGGSSWPGFTCLLKEMLGLGMAEDSAWLNLSDGGHIENSACYELLRRRCKFIIAVDGEADPSLSFAGLITLTRHAQVNLGIHIDARLDDLRPDPKTGHSQRHTVLCRVHYPPAPGETKGSIGLLLYLKLSLTGNESELIRRYRAVNPAFPHQSTLDQFFDEEQFEAYRQLGVHVTEGFFSRALLNNRDPPATIADWFKCLARNLLEPKVG